MSTFSTDRIDTSESLLIIILEALEAHGVKSEEYQLYDEIDVEALERVILSSSTSIKISFTVCDLRLAIKMENSEIYIEKIGCKDS
ncbi:hypothetical protein ACFQDG_00270 [Natronoarchaeum mannanilyticum]|uniref:hypothetical protein n=1 Tax=Natronoarchaeum mannanilyticum TaxID=926360 RepID=UPI0031DBF4E2